MMDVHIALIQRPRHGPDQSWASLSFSRESSAVLRLLNAILSLYLLKASRRSRPWNPMHSIFDPHSSTVLQTCASAPYHHHLTRPAVYSTEVMVLTEEVEAGVGHWR